MRARSGLKRSRFLLPLFLLCAASLLTDSCEFTLYPDGIGPGPSPTPEDEVCPNPFPGLTPFKTSPETTLDNTLKEPAAVAVVPHGMTFTFTPEGASATVTAEAGDVLVADLDTEEIYFYDRSAGDRRWIFPGKAEELGGGLALYYEEADPSTGRDEVRLLLYTGTSSPLNKSNLFVLDLDPATPLTPNPFRIPDDAQGLLPGLTDFYDAQAVAVGREDTKRGVFVSDPTLQANDYSVYRITLVLTGNTPVPETMSRLAYGFKGIRDVGYSQATRDLYMTEYDGSTLNNSTVYRIQSALTASSASKSSLSPFVPSSQLKTSTGLDLPPTEKDGSEADLLVLSQEVTRALGRFDSEKGGFALGYMSISKVEVLQDLAYDCTNERILFTRKTFSYGLYEFNR